MLRKLGGVTNMGVYLISFNFITAILTWRESRALWGNRRCKQGWTHLGKVMQYWVTAPLYGIIPPIFTALSLENPFSLRLHTLGANSSRFWGWNSQRKKPSYWEMAAEFQRKTAGKSSKSLWVCQCQALPKARDYLLLQKREGSGTGGSHKERERAGMGSSLPGPSALFKSFLSTGLLAARPEGEGKGFHLPSIDGKGH